MGHIANRFSMRLALRQVRVESPRALTTQAEPWSWIHPLHAIARLWHAASRIEPMPADMTSLRPLRLAKAETDRARGLALPRLGRGQHGSILIETMLAAVTFSVVGLAVLLGLQTLTESGSKTLALADAENISVNQMEDSFNRPYKRPPHTYPSVSSPSGYTVTSVAEEYVVGDANIQKIVVTVAYGESRNYVLEALRTK